MTSPNFIKSNLIKRKAANRLISFGKSLSAGERFRIAGNKAVKTINRKRHEMNLINKELKINHSLPSKDSVKKNIDAIYNSRKDFLRKYGKASEPFSARTIAPKVARTSALGLGAVAAAGAYGAYRIRKASKAANKEISSQHSPARNKAHRESILAIRAQGARKRAARTLRKTIHKRRAGLPQSKYKAVK